MTNENSSFIPCCTGFIIYYSRIKKVLILSAKCEKNKNKAI